MESIFRQYDIRGEVGVNLTPDIARKIGRAFADFTKCNTVAVGRDNRNHSPEMFKALAEGLTIQGATVIDMGECSTPMSYFGTSITGADAGIMITASHLPGKYNGFKLSRADAVPISGDNGIMDIKEIVEGKKKFKPKAKIPGKIKKRDIAKEYAEMVRKSSDIRRPVRIVADLTYAMGVSEAKVFDGVKNLEVVKLHGDLASKKYDIPDPDPIKPENLATLSKAVKAGKGKYAFGVMFDPDADRTGFTDEKGRAIPMDITAALIAQEILRKNPGAAVGYDLRSSWAVDETIRIAGGKPFRTKVGHANIKQKMRVLGAKFVGELSGHYYFMHEPKKGVPVYGESSSLATIIMANILSKTRKTLSELVKPIRRYFASGECNSKLADKEQAGDAIARIKAKYREDGWINELDGVSVMFDDWWFNVRCSNTEAKIRLNVESTISRKHMEEMRDMLKKFIGGKWEGAGSAGRQGTDGH